MAANAARRADVAGLMRRNARSVGWGMHPRQAGPKEDHRHVDPPTRDLGDGRASVRPGLRPGAAADATRKPAPAASAPSPAKPATTGAATAPAAVKINLNTATEAELDKLPHVGAHRSKAIIAARTKEKFKSWDDFMARKVVPADVAAAIKDSVTF
jgi:hypothetical protein